MKNREIAVELISKAVSSLNKALTVISADEEEPEKSTPPAKTKGRVAPTANKSTDKTAPKTKGKSTDDSGYTAEQLSEMSYNDLKKLCKELGIPAIGSRTQIVEKILSGGVDTAPADDDEEEEAPTSKKSGKTPVKPIKKNSKPADDDEEDEDGEDEEADEEEESDTLKLVLEATEDMSVEEIAELLTENGISAKGKRQALIDRLVKAIDDGVISFEDGEEDDEEEAPDSDEDKEDEDRNPDFDNLSKARAKTFKKMSAEATANFESGKLKIKAVKKYVSEYYDGDIDLDDVDDEEIFEHYLELLSLTIDDDGEVAESEEPYIINDRAYCCGHLCDYSEENGTYTCPICGGEYEAE